MRRVIILSSCVLLINILLAINLIFWIPLFIVSVWFDAGVTISSLLLRFKKYYFPKMNLIQSLQDDPKQTKSQYCPWFMSLPICLLLAPAPARQDQAEKATNSKTSNISFISATLIENSTIDRRTNSKPTINTLLLLDLCILYLLDDDIQ